MKSKSVYYKEKWKLIYNQLFWKFDVPNWTDKIFRKEFRITRTTFQIIVDTIKENVEKKNTKYELTIEKRMGFFLYFLKSGSPYGAVATVFSVGKTTVCGSLTAVSSDSLSLNGLSCLN